MNKNPRTWVKPTLTVISLALLAWYSPVAPLDPWNLLSPKKIATMVFALATIQAFGSAIAQYLGIRTGSILTGFFGGLISSTATTASLARRSRARPSDDSGEVLIFLSATGAMLFEGLAIVIAGTADVHLSNLVIFIGPIIATLGMIVVEYRTHPNRSDSADTSTFQILPILKLSFFIVVILSASKISQNAFGQKGLLVLTSLVSLFEIHGSVIANVHLHESGAVSVNFLCSLLAVSVVASYLSKLFLISTIGSSKLRSKAVRRTLILFCALALSWLIAVNLS